MTATEHAPEIGATERELNSMPGLLTDLALSMVPRRLGIVQGILTLLGGFSRDKVRTLLCMVKRAQNILAERSGPYSDACSLYEAARDLFAAVAKLEAAVFSLVAARAKYSQRVHAGV